MPTIQKTLQILEYIRLYQRFNYSAPTLRKLGDKFGMRSVASIHRHLTVMQDRGWIRREPYERRIEIIKPERKIAA